MLNGERQQFLLAVVGCRRGDAGAGIGHSSTDSVRKRESAYNDNRANDGKDQSIFSCRSAAVVTKE